MKIDMDALNCIRKLSLKRLLSMSFRFEMRTKLPGVGVDHALRGKGSWRTTGGNPKFVFT